MADFTISPNMSLPVPVVGVTTGPTYAAYIDSSLSILDGHNHSPGSGAQITPSGLNINADLPLNNNNLVTIKTLTFQAQTSNTGTAAIYVIGVDLYYNDGSGNAVRITQSGSVAGASGTITGLPSGTASASYGGGTFVFQSATSTAANIDGASFLLRNSTANSNALTLSPPNAMGANYTLVLPNLPPVLSIMALDSAGNMSAPYTVDNSTIIIDTGGIIKVPPQGITPTQILNNSITSAQISSATLTGTQIATNGIFPGNLPFPNDAGSGGSGAFNTTSTSFVNVTNNLATITTNGRPVMICIKSDLSGSGGSFGSTTNVGVGQSGLVVTSAILAVTRNGVIVSEYQQTFSQNVASTNFATTLSNTNTLPGCILDTAVVSAPGTYGYQVLLKLVNGVTAFCNNSQIFVYEL